MSRLTPVRHLAARTCPIIALAGWTGHPGRSETASRPTAPTALRGRERSVGSRLTLPRAPGGRRHTGMGSRPRRPLVARPGQAWQTRR